MTARAPIFAQLDALIDQEERYAPRPQLRLTHAERYDAALDFRPCFICGGHGWCKHRELRVVEAESAARRRMIEGRT